MRGKLAASSLGRTAASSEPSNAWPSALSSRSSVVGGRRNAISASAAARGDIVSGRDFIVGSYREHVLKKRHVRRSMVFPDVSLRCRSKQSATTTCGFDKALAFQWLSGWQ